MCHGVPNGYAELWRRSSRESASNRNELKSRVSHNLLKTLLKNAVPGFAVNQTPSTKRWFRHRIKFLYLLNNYRIIIHKGVACGFNPGSVFKFGVFVNLGVSNFKMTVYWI